MTIHNTVSFGVGMMVKYVNSINDIKHATDYKQGCDGLHERNPGSGYDKLSQICSQRIDYLQKVASGEIVPMQERNVCVLM